MNEKKRLLNIFNFYNFKKKIMGSKVVLDSVPPPPKKKATVQRWIKLTFYDVGPSALIKKLKIRGVFWGRGGGETNYS